MCSRNHISGVLLKASVKRTAISGEMPPLPFARLFALGATEILVSPVPASVDRAAAPERILWLLSHVAHVAQA